MSGVATAVVVGSYVASEMAADSAKDASKTQAKSAREGMQMEREMFDLAREDRQPFVQLGQQGINRLGRMLDGNFQTSPGYQFRLEQGQRGLDNRLASMGMKNSGRALKELSTFNQGMAAQEYDSAFNRLYNLATLGSNAASGNANAAMQMGGDMRDTQMQIGNAVAAGQVGAGNARADAINNGLLTYGYLNQ